MADPKKFCASIVKILRADRPLDPNTRKLLANLFDDKASSRFVVTIKERKARGRRPPHVKWLLFKLMWPSLLSDANGGVDAAVKKAEETFGKKRATIYKWIKSKSSKST